ncbi:hypothetical protein [Paraburkholderia sp.]|uniref:hypothetical protein n=1 Tax=Paraburkholderia sp. TaxID=1926495 RepID=UPI003D700173
MNVDFVVMDGAIVGAACAYCLAEARRVALLARKWAGPRSMIADDVPMLDARERKGEGRR